MTVSLSRPSVSSPGCRHAITLSAPDCACCHLNHLAIAGARPPQVLRVNEAGGAPSHVPARRTAEALDGSRTTHPTPPQGTLIACRGPALHASAHHGALDSPLHLKDGSATGAEGGAEAGASGSAAAGGGGAMADDEEGGGSGGGGPTSPSRAQRQHLAAGSVARLAKSPLVQLASLLLADRQVLLVISDCMPISSLISAARVAPTRRLAGASSSGSGHGGGGAGAGGRGEGGEGGAGARCALWADGARDGANRARAHQLGGVR